MKHSIIISLSIILLLATPQPASSQNAVSLDEVRQAGLRVVEVTTVDGEEPQGEEIASPVYEGVYNYTYTNKVHCKIVITMGEDTLYNSGEYEKDTSGATIRINGNTSAYYSLPLNMPYKLKLEKKADLLCRPDSAHFADKNWRLIKDALSLNTMVGLKVSQLMGMEWTAAYTPCNLIINGDYRGCYLLIETVRRNPKCRIDTDKEQGYIVERDPYWWKEQHHFTTLWYENADAYRWTWKYPDDDNITEEKEEYIRQCINRAEQGIRGNDFDKYIDLVSFAKWLLAHDILGTRDSGGSNLFIKKYDESDSTLLEMPCLWDFDSNYGVGAGSFSRLHTSSNAYFSTLLQSSNKAFARQYVLEWNKLKDSLPEELASFVNDYAASAEAKALDISRRLNNRRWNTTYPSVNSDARIALQWFEKHIPLLDSQIELIKASTLDITPVIENRQNEKRLYDLRGIQHNSHSKNDIVVKRSTTFVRKR